VQEGAPASSRASRSNAVNKAPCPRGRGRTTHKKCGMNEGRARGTRAHPSQECGMIGAPCPRDAGAPRHVCLTGLYAALTRVNDWPTEL
jgi:hypothetical protein